MPQFNEGNINSYLVPSGSLTGSLSNSGTLTGQIAIGSGGGTTDYNDLTNKPQINSVTLSGNKTTADLNISYNDLTNKPTLATVATTGDYDDLTDKPTIPTVLNDLSDVNINNPYQTDVLSYDESTSKWINHPVSLTVEGLSNVALSTPIAGKVLKISSISSSGPVWRSSYVNYNEINGTPTLATVATSGDYDDLTNKPTIPAAQVNSDWDAESGVEQILNKPELATVATSGSYDDLTDTPTLAAVATSGNYNDLTIPTTCSISRGSSVPATFPVPNISRRGNTVIVRFGVLLPAGTYSSSDALWNYSPVMVGLPALTFPVYGSGEVNLLKINTDGTITMNATKTFATDTWLIGEAVFLTDG